MINAAELCKFWHLIFWYFISKQSGCGQYQHSCSNVCEY